MINTVKDKDFVTKILPDVTGINFTTQELAKISQILQEKTGSAPLFTYINLIYGLLGANLKNPGKIIIIPFIDENKRPHINIQRIS